MLLSYQYSELSSLTACFLLPTGCCQIISPAKLRQPDKSTSCRGIAEAKIAEKKTWGFSRPKPGVRWKIAASFDQMDAPFRQVESEIHENFTVCQAVAVNERIKYHFKIAWNRLQLISATKFLNVTTVLLVQLKLLINACSCKIFNKCCHNSFKFQPCYVACCFNYHRI